MRYRIVAFLCSLLMPFACLLFLFGTDKLIDFLRSIVFESNPHYHWLGQLIVSSFGGALLFSSLIAGPTLLGWILARRTFLPLTCFPRYFPLFLPIMLWLLAGIILQRLFHPALLVMLLPAILLLFIYCLFFAAFMLTARRRKRSLSIKKGTLKLAACMGAALLAVVLNQWQINSNTLYGFDPDIESVGHGVYVYDYLPYYQDNKLVVPDTPPSLHITKNHPRLDGAIALLPVYGAAAQALYTDVATEEYWEYEEETAPQLPHIFDLVDCTNTPSAWERLINGDIDIFFGAPPSQAQLQMAYEAGLEPVLTPIAKDAFVFMVNVNNPVDGLSTAQIRDIYRKNITNWAEVGGEAEKILPFQRPDGSGSQTTMSEMVMDGLDMAMPLREEYAEGMGDIINSVAEFRNRKEAIGYTFRWYATVQFPSDQVKLLAVDGVSPLPEKISSDAYPFTTQFVAVTCRQPSPESRDLIQWLLGPEGQALIAKTGYIPLNTP